VRGDPQIRLKTLLRLDSAAGAIAGTAVLIAELATGGWLHVFYGFPRQATLVLGVMNLIYASASGTLARQARPAAKDVLHLARFNCLWAALCFAAAAVAATEWLAPRPTAFGFAQLVVEGLFVGALARAEWRLAGTIPS
jgi:hypothetical protein